MSDYVFACCPLPLPTPPPDLSRAYPSQIIRQLMSAGVPLSKLDDLVPMFNGLRANMCGSSKGKEYIGFVAEEEVRRTREEVAGKYVSVAIDCTPFSGTVSTSPQSFE